MTTLHMFEPGGAGGVFQHAVAVADMLADDGHQVVLHTATDAEITPRSAAICACVDWERERRPSPIRSMLVLLRYLMQTTPHMARRVGSSDCLHTQGRFKPGLLLLVALIAKLRGAWVVASPHNLFERDGAISGRASLWAELRLADSVIVFSEADRARARSLGVEAIWSPLVMHLEGVSDEQAAKWRRRWEAPPETKVILFAGQLRPDKRLDLVIRAVAELPRSRWRLAVVGEDKGSERDARVLATQLGVNASWEVAYVGAADFAAAISAADVVCCPYDRASQSAILSLARQLRVPTVARAVGGLEELASETVRTEDPTEIARACERAIAQNPQTPNQWWADALSAQLRGCRRTN